MAQENQIVVRQMTAADVGLLSTTISNMALDNSLVKFRLISQTINEATGLVPKKVVPSLQRLSVSYSSVSAAIRKGLSLTSATAFKFIVKSCKALERGLTPYDLKVLQELGRQLNQGYITELDQFIDTARQDLVAIYTALLPEAAGVHVKSLLEKRDKKEKELIELSQRLKLSAEESGALQGKIDATDYEIEICEQAAGDSVAAKQRMEIELQTLKDKIPHYEEQVQVHRDYHTEERGSFWIFSWKVRDVHVNNGESIARENVAALRQRIQLLEQQIKNWSVEALQKRKAVAISELPKLKESRDAQAQQREILQKDRDRLEREFQEIIKKIQSHYTEAGTSSVEAMLMVDELASAVWIGSDSLHEAYGQLIGLLASVDTDPDLIVGSVLTALKLVAYADQYGRTNRLLDLKLLLALDAPRPQSRADRVQVSPVE